MSENGLVVTKQQLRRLLLGDNAKFYDLCSQINDAVGNPTYGEVVADEHVLSVGQVLETLEAGFVVLNKKALGIICHKIRVNLNMLDYERYHGDLNQSITPILREIRKSLDEILEGKTE